MSLLNFCEVKIYSGCSKLLFIKVHIILANYGKDKGIEGKN